MSKKVLCNLLTMLVIAAFLLSACGAKATATPVATARNKVLVGIVLPTKDEPRWIQDQTRFQDALKAAGYNM